MKGLRWIVWSMSLWCALLQGYIYEIKVLRKWNTSLNCYQYWIGFSDFHDKNHKDTNNQRKKIEEWLLLYAPNDILVLAEDLSSANNELNAGYATYYINSRTGILAGLCTYCKQHQIPVVNVEYRYCRVVALGPVINNISADPSLFSSTKKITIAQLVQEIEQMQMNLLKTNHVQFKVILTQKSAAVSNQMKKLTITSDSYKSMADYLNDLYKTNNRLELVQQLLTFDGIFIGMKFVDATLKADNAKKLLVFGGGTHINEAYELLQKIAGYEPVNAIDAQIFKGSLVSKSIGTPLIDTYRAKPEPISLELLEHYLKN